MESVIRQNYIFIYFILERGYFQFWVTLFRSYAYYSIYFNWQSKMLIISKSGLSVENRLQNSLALFSNRKHKIWDLHLVNEKCGMCSLSCKPYISVSVTEERLESKPLSYWLIAYDYSRLHWSYWCLTYIALAWL